MDVKRWILVLFLVVTVLAAFGIFAFSVPHANAVRNLLEDTDVPQIIISNDARQALNQEYGHSDSEFSACLDVKQNLFYQNTSLKTQYEVTGITALQSSGGSNYAEQVYCEYGSIHSHPGKSCFFSLADIYSIKARFKNGEMFAVVMCGVDNFYYVTRNNFEEKKIN
jgi:hypothetical protein